MAHPKKRMSPVRSGNRRRQIGLNLPMVLKCPSCGKMMISHQACRFCGVYRGRTVISKAV